MNEAIKRITIKFQQAREKLGIKFMVNPPMSETEVTVFEAQHGIVLPNEFRTFVLSLGNGGTAGPFGNLISSQEWLRDPVNAPSRESPLPPKEGKYSSDELEAIPEDAWGDGALRLSDQGSGWETVLVVFGKARGRVVYTDFCQNLIFPRQKNFLEWYEAWLDGLLTGNDKLP